MSRGKGRITFSALFAVPLLFFSCASTPKPDGTSKIPSDDSVVTVTIPSSRKESRAYFSSISSRVMELVEIGSPKTLRQAASLLHKSAQEEYETNERVLLAVCAEIMHIVWPSEQVTWDVPQSDTVNPYMGAIDSARRGIYDSSTGNSDFLTILLPSLVLLSGVDRSDYYDVSEQSLSQALSMRPDSVLANYLLGKLKSARKDYDAAFSYFEQCRKYAAEVFEVKFALAETLFLRGDMSRSLALSEELLSSYPQNVQLLEICAESSFALGKMEKSESYVVRVLSLEPENLRYVLFRARILMEKGDFIRAASLLDAYARNDVSSKNYLVLRARLQRDWNKNNTAASETIASAMNLYPGDSEVLLLAAQIASSANTSINGMDALEIAQKVLEQDPSSLSAAKICISELIRKGEWQKAYTMSLGIMGRSSDSEIISNHIDICLALSKFTEATECADRMYKNAPQSEAAQQAYIKVLVATGQRSLAKQMIASLMDGSEARMKSFLYYQRSFFGATEDEILGDLRSSLTANPRNRDALFLLYKIYYAKKDWRRAQYYLKQVVALDPLNTEVLRLNSELNSLLGK